jgi:SNF2 family DNA or RNA helicase
MEKIFTKDCCYLKTLFRVRAIKKQKVNFRQESAMIFFCTKTNVFHTTSKVEGWIKNPVTKRYETKFHFKVARLRKEFHKLDKSARVELDKYSTKKFSEPWAGRPLIFKEGGELRHCQPKALEFSLTRDHSYLALEQGLGKTPVAITWLNTITKFNIFSSFTLLIIPPFLKSNWQRELTAWLPSYRSFKILESEDDLYSYYAEQGPLYDIVIVPDSLVISPHFLNLGQFENLIVDEAHRFNGDSKRSKALIEMKIRSGVERSLLLSGTPMRGKPIELWNVIRHFAWNTIDYMPEDVFIKRYCGGGFKEFKKYNKQTKRKEIKKVLNRAGSSNLKELGERISKYMLREKFDDYFKIDVKSRVIILDGKVPKEIKKFEEKTFKKKKLSDYLDSDSLGALAKYRYNLSKALLKPALQYLESKLSGDDGLLIGYWHTDLGEELKSELEKKSFKVGFIKGGVKTKERDQIIKNYLNGDLDAIVAQVTTMVGLNIPRGREIVFVESDWTPDSQAQFISRIKRDGFKGKNILVTYLALAGTLHEHILRRSLDKESDIGKLFSYAKQNERK